MSVVDPVTFARDVLVNPGTGEPFTLYPMQARFLTEAFTLTPDGRLPYAELGYSTIKKDGKTTTGGISAVYSAAVLCPRYGEVIIAANDLEQSQGRVFQVAARLCEESPMLRSETKVTAQRIEFRRTGAVILAIANDWRGAAGSEPNLVLIDEPWAMTSESSSRLLDELVPPPTRKVAARMWTTYAGFLEESLWLWKQYQRGLKGTEIAPALYAQPGMLMLWSHLALSPWNTPAEQARMREQLRPNAYLRMCENRWVSTENGFVDLDWYDACVDPLARPIIADASLEVFVGVDASVKRDQTAIVVTAWDEERKRVRLVQHRIFQPSPDRPIDFEGTIERSLLEIRERFRVREVRFDPYQMVASAQRLTQAGLPMKEFAQSPGNLTEASQNLYDLIRGRNLVVYPDPELRLAVSRAIAVEGLRGWRIAKEKAAHKIDVIVALAQSALGAVSQPARAVVEVRPGGW